VLERINFEIRSKEKIAVVGRNGCGKTTLLKLIAGEVELSKRDSDEDIYIARAGKPVIGYLKQSAFEDDSLTMEQEVRKAFSDLLQMKAEMERLVEIMGKENEETAVSRYVRLEERFAYLGGYSFEKEYEIVIKKLGFLPEDKQKKLSEFSGGQQTKIAFARMLLSKPDILLLDEPTNHLDMATISWLEGYLKDYDRAVVIVSHDRMFLDRVVDVVYEIEYKTAVRYPGNYSAFVERKRLNWEKQKKDYELQQKEIERLQKLVDRFKNKPTKVAMTRSKLKQIEHMVKIDAPDRYDLKSFHADFQPARESVTDVLRTERLRIGYDRPLAEVSFEQKKGQKIGIIGDNGSGKSTLLRTLTGQLEPLGGSFTFGERTDIGYFEQQMAQYTSDNTVLDDFWEEFPDRKRLEVRSWLGAFLFGQEEVFKKINMLSGGEKVRLALAKIFMRLPNYLILDVKWSRETCCAYSAWS
jgi:ATP-binding cassette subfamily F protein 3